LKETRGKTTASINSLNDFLCLFVFAVDYRQKTKSPAETMGREKQIDLKRQEIQFHLMTRNDNAVKSREIVKRWQDIPQFTIPLAIVF
jgi:hypothetical protein